MKNFKVYVSVFTEEKDKMEGEIIESHIKRELRALGDVEIVGFKDDWRFRIRITVLGHISADDRKMPHVSIAQSTQVRVPKQQLFKHVPVHIPVYDPDGPYVAYWPKNGLPAWCVLRVNIFDKHLEIYRK